MNSSGLFQEIKQHPWILALVIALHMGLAALLGVNLMDSSPHTVQAVSKQIINAVAVEAEKYDEREQQKKLAKQRAEKLKRDKILAKKKREQEKKKQIALKKRKAELKKKQEKARKEKLHKERLRKEKLIAQKKKAEKLKQKKLKQERIKKEKLAALKKKQAAIDLEKKREQERKKIAKEKRLAELEKQKKLAAEAEKKRLAELEKQRLAEDKAEFERSLLEEERHEEEARLQRERTAQLQSLRAQYVTLITQKVESNWLRPAGAKGGQSCEVIVTQTYTGDVIGVRLQACQADKTFRRSVESAVWKASPLPMPPGPDVFDREIQFTFKPN